MCSRPRRRAVWFGVSAALFLAAPLAAQARGGIEESRRRLDSIRIEREQLQRQQQRLESQVKDVGAELHNIEQQRRSTNRIINELDRQIGALNNQTDQVSAEVVLAQDNLAEKRAVLHRRLVDIYKRGPLYAWQVLLAAESFGDLLRRYKYLFLTSRQDRALVIEVENLRDRVSRRRNELLGLRTDLDRNRSERDAELDRYSSLASARERRLRELRRTGVRTEERLSQLEKDEADLNQRLNALIAAANRRGGAAAPGAVTTADIGKLDWPVDGRILYGFGRERLPDGVVVRHNGIAIGAPVGTPVRTIAAGKVAVIQRWNTYGLLVLIDHGAQYYSLYAQLNEARVRVGDAVTKGQVVGTVGGQNTPQGSHLYFEIRGEGAIALDPTDWLRRQGGG